MTVTPKWGQPHVVPEDAIAAWGARAIVTQQGDVDILPDRQGSDEGPHGDELYDVLDVVLPTVRATLRDLLRSYEMQTNVREDFIVFHDDRLIVHANTNGSAGYCYITAWLYKEDS